VIGISLLLATALAVQEAPTLRAFTLIGIDGRRRECVDLAVSTSGQVHCAGEVALVGLDDLMAIVVTPADGAAANRPAGPQVFVLADGSRLHGRLVDGPRASRHVIADLGLGEPLQVPFDSLAAVRLSDAGSEAGEREWSARLSRRDTTRDFLIVLGPSGITALPGALEELSSTGWAFRFGQQMRRGEIDKLYAVVFAAGTSKAAPWSARVRMRDGDFVSASLVLADSGGARLRTSFSDELSIPWDRIDRIDLRSRRLEFLSDLTPVKVESRGYFGYAWPWRADQSLSGGPLRAGGQTFAKGLAVHARCVLSYELAEPFERLLASIGLDDSASGGNAVFRVRGDGKALFESGPVRAGDVARDIDVGLEGVRQLELEVDYGDGLDLGDRAIWGQARLMR